MSAFENTNTGDAGYTDNVLATARQFGDGFKFKFGGIQLSSYNMNMDKLLKFFNGQLVTEEAKEGTAADQEVLNAWDAKKQRYSGINNPAFHRTYLEATPTSMADVEAEVPETTVPNVAPGKLSPSSIVAYSVNNDGYENITLENLIKDNLLKNKMLSDDESLFKITTVSSGASYNAEVNTDTGIYSVTYKGMQNSISV